MDSETIYQCLLEQIKELKELQSANHHEVLAVIQRLSGGEITIIDQHERQRGSKSLALHMLRTVLNELTTRNCEFKA
jgi:hypothetical protein